MTREQQIRAGKVWQVYPASNADSIFFEGSRAACLRWLKEYGYWPSYKQGNIRVGKLIWEQNKVLDTPC